MYTPETQENIGKYKKSSGKILLLSIGLLFGVILQKSISYAYADCVLFKAAEVEFVSIFAESEVDAEMVKREQAKWPSSANLTNGGFTYETPKFYIYW